MSPVAILYPAIAMFVLSFGVILSLGAARYGAIRRGAVRISYFRTYNEGTQPARLHLLQRHVQNHFEVPPLFYIGVILTFVSGSVTALSVFLAWAFVAARAVHTFVHLGSNNVTHRFFVFGASLTALAGIWLTLLYSLVSS